LQVLDDIDTANPQRTPQRPHACNLIGQGMAAVVDYQIYGGFLLPQPVP
jgi:hypothetical protein